MGRKLGIDAATVMGWKRRRRIPAKHQGLVLERGNSLQLNLTAEDVMFPFPEDRGAQA